MTAEPPTKCIACGWSTEEQSKCSYESHVKLFYGASKRGVWSIGSDVILKERPDDGSRNEADVLRYLEAQPDIPAPKLLRDWADSDGRYFMLVERLRGQTLEQAWPSLSEEQKADIADHVVAVRKALRNITASAIQSVNGGQCTPVLLTLASGDQETPPFSADFNLCDAIRRTLREREFPEDVLNNLLNRLPKGEPYVLTHCDLNLGNIVVKEDGSLAGILDWEYAAFYPLWYEYVSASWGWTEEDVEWKKLLKERLRLDDDGYEEARDFWMDMYALRKYPDLDEAGKEIMGRLGSSK
ncbi:kinase-like protein [Aspergillus pseudoustus]|uniref:Kinase-like protein n=1 Tax=Aspergillus pseudoustus TaxID=1810923 RepID=A0ABR4IBV6_9EURO